MNLKYSSKAVNSTLDTQENQVTKIKKWSHNCQGTQKQNK